MRQRGFNLIELVAVMVIVAIVVTGLAYFASPIKQSVDVSARADLTDAANTALQRIGRDVRLALPNSVRVDGTQKFIEFLAVRTAARYRADGGGGTGGTNCPSDDPTLTTAGDNDQLSFDLAAGDTCFKTLGKIPDVATVATGTDRLVLNNYGSGFSGQDAYSSTAPLNWVVVSAIDSASEATRDRVSFAATTFQRVLHASPGKRFFIISGAVSYGCDLSAGTVTRYWGYSIQATQPTTFGGASSALIASQVTACAFDYTPNVEPQVGLLTLRLTLSKSTTTGVPEVVTLYHAAHMSNVP